MTQNSRPWVKLMWKAGAKIYIYLFFPITAKSTLQSKDALLSSIWNEFVINKYNQSFKMSNALYFYISEFRTEDGVACVSDWSW